MTDIFLSYASDDRERVRPLVQAFEAQGWGVWWDQEIRTGESWDRRIEQALDECQACVVAWTRTSAESQWVRNESMAAMEAGKLFPVRLDDATIPIAFRSVQTAELTRWRGGQDDRLDQLIETLGEHVHTAVRPVPATTAPRTRTRRLRWATISLVGIVAATLIYYLGDLTATDSADVAPTESDDPNASLVVLPFENLSTDEANAFFAIGTYEDILNNLTRVPKLRVISRYSAERAMANGASTQAIAAELRVAHILVGSVQRAANQVRVSVRLIDARTDSPIWGESYQRELTDIFAIQSEIARDVADQLALELEVGLQQAIAAGPTSEIAAYDLFLRARELYANLRVSTDGDRALKMIDEAIEIDPQFADAYALRSRIKGSLLVRTRGLVISRQEALIDAERALALDEDNTLAHLAMAQVFFMDPPRAEPFARRAIESSPGEADARRALYRILMLQGKSDEAFTHLRVALDIDPLNAETMIGMAGELDRRGRVEEAEEYLRDAIALDPTNSQTQRLTAYFYDSRRDRYNALRHIATARALDDNEIAIVETIVINLAALGAADAALRWSDKMQPMGANSDWINFVRYRAMEAGRRVEELESLAAERMESFSLRWPWLPDARLQRAAMIAGQGDIEEAGRLRRLAYEGFERWWGDYAKGLIIDSDRFVLGVAISALHVGADELAVELLNAVVEFVPLRRDLVTTGIEPVVALAALGRVDEAVELFAELVDNRPPAIWSLDAWGLMHDPIYHGLHEDPRFVAKAKELDRRTSEVLRRVRLDLPELFVVENSDSE